MIETMSEEIKTEDTQGNGDLGIVSNLFSAQDRLLETPLEPWMLVPCDLEGEPMLKPDEESLRSFNASLIPPYQIGHHDLCMWVDGSRRVIFRGFHVNDTGDDIIHKNTGLVVGVIGERTTLLFKTIGELCRAMEENGC